MCSIGGFITSQPLVSSEASLLAKALLFYGQGRGSQSAGVLFGNKLLKKAVHPEELPYDDSWDSIFSEPANICLTHTRHPTCGGRGDPQAQPFVHEKVATVHNGWYSNPKELKEDFRIAKPSGVDSELACRYASTYGPDSLPEFIASAAGSSAIACKYEDSLYFIRSGGPLCYATFSWENPDKSTFDMLLFASEGTQLARSIRYLYLLEDITLHELKEGFLFKATPTGVEQVSEKKVEHVSFSYTYDMDFNPSWKNWAKSAEKEDLICLTFLDGDEYGEYEDAKESLDPDDQLRVVELVKKARLKMIRDGFSESEIADWYD